MSDPVSLGAVEIDEDRQLVERAVRAVLDAHRGTGGEIGGFAFMVWDVDGASTCDSRNKNSNIPSILVPDFVRNRLLARKIEEWTIDTLNGT